MIRALLVLFLVFGIGYAKSNKEIATDIVKILYPKGSLQSQLDLLINMNPKYTEAKKSRILKFLKKANLYDEAFAYLVLSYELELTNKELQELYSFLTSPIGQRNLQFSRELSLSFTSFTNDLIKEKIREYKYHQSKR